MAGKIKRVFPGGNTSRGFYSYYDNIIEEDANRIFVIKGGPGTGKSSMMKQVAQDMLDMGYDVEYHHCSSDNSSIDGIVIPQLRVAMIDGTAPHIVDPKNPGAVDEIVHLGDYWDLEKMESNKEKILESIGKNGEFYKRAYKYLEAAKLIQDDIKWKIGESMETGQVNVATYNLIAEIFGDSWISPLEGKDRHLFGSAYTPTGWIEYTDTLLEQLEKIYYVTGEIGTGKSRLLGKIAEEAKVRGMDVEIYHTPLVPEEIETVIIKDIGIGLTTSELARMFDYEQVDLSQYINEDILKNFKDDIKEDKRVFQELIAIASKEFALAKKNHDGIEEYYVPNMDFDAIERVREEIVERILSYQK